MSGAAKQPSFPPEMARLLGSIPLHGDHLERHLANQIAGLREDIAALRRDLAPASGLIQMGADVVQEFRRLNAKKAGAET